MKENINWENIGDTIVLIIFIFGIIMIIILLAILTSQGKIFH